MTFWYQKTRHIWKPDEKDPHLLFIFLLRQKSFFWPPVLPCRLGKKISSSNIWNHWKIQLVTGNCMLKCAETALFPIKRIGGVCLRPKMKDDILFTSVIHAVLCHKTEAISVSLNAVWAQQLNYKTTMSDDNKGLIPAAHPEQLSGTWSAWMISESYPTKIALLAVMEDVVKKKENGAHVDWKYPGTPKGNGNHHSSRMFFVWTGRLGRKLSPAAAPVSGRGADGSAVL